MTASFHSTDGASSLVGDLVNLSIGGVCVKFRELPPGKRWLTTFTLGEEGPTLTIPVEEVHATNEQPGQFGFRFLPRPNPRVLEEQERMIWSFLLDEQRGQRRHAREAGRATG